MNYPNLMAIVCLCFLLLTAGCYNTTTEQREDPSTELVIDLENTTAVGEDVRLGGAVVLLNPIHNVTVHDVVLEFIAENGSTMETITIGELESGDGRTLPTVEFKTTFDDPPTELRFRIGRVENPENARFFVDGLRLKSEDPIGYVAFTQDEYTIVPSETE
jgi:hypothetical protein